MTLTERRDMYAVQYQQAVQNLSALQQQVFRLEGAVALCNELIAAEAAAAPPTQS